MKILSSFWVAVLFLAAVLAGPRWVLADRVESRRFPAAVEKSTRPASAFLGEGGRPFIESLPPISVDMRSEVPGLKKTGVVYPLAVPIQSAQLQWEPVAGGWAARVRLAAEGAGRLRLHILSARIPEGTTFRVQGGFDPIPRGPVAPEKLMEGGLWLPPTDGNQADLEIFVPETQRPETVDLAIDRVNYQPPDPDSGNASAAAETLQKSTGAAMELEYDLACWSDSEYYTGLQEAAAATALVEFIKGRSSFLCTGTLLNDKGNTRTPWFATANHCVSDQATADTASFEWFYQATRCRRAATDPRHFSTAGGGQLLWHDDSLDAAFLRLNQTPGGDVAYSGWETDIHLGDLVWGVHHPEGDHTMVSRGSVTALLKEVFFDQSSRPVDEVIFTDGGAEPGSSGSGLFSITTDGGVYWKGTLEGGPVFNYQINDYSPFREYFPNIQRWLHSCALPWGGGIDEGGTVTAYQSATSTDCAAISETRACSDGILSGSYTQQSCVLPAPCALPWGGMIQSGESVTAYASNVSPQCAAISEQRVCVGGNLTGSYSSPSCEAPLTVVYPNGGETLQAKARVTVQWRLAEAEPKSKVGIAYSRNGGRSWTTLATRPGSSGTWPWKIRKSQASTQGLIRVCRRPTPNLPRYCDVSDGPFTVTR